MRLQDGVEYTTTSTSDDGEDYWTNMSPAHRALFTHASQRQVDGGREGRWIPRSEQDEDRWRHLPGRDPVTEERGMGMGA